MISVLLIILKIIGIILLCLIGLLLLIILAFLFVPLRYSISISKNDSIKGKIAVSYLLHILHFNMFYEDKKLYAKICLFGITIKTIDLINKNTDKDDQNTNKGSNKKFGINSKNNSSTDNCFNNEEGHLYTSNESSDEKNLWDVLNELEEDGDIDELDLGELKNFDSLNLDNNHANTSGITDNTFDEDEFIKDFSEEIDIDKLFDNNIFITEEKINPEQKAQKISEKISKFLYDNLERIKNTLKKIYDKIKQIYSKLTLFINKLEEKYIKADKFWWLITSAEFQSAFRLCKSSLFKILKRILPKRMDLDLKFGLNEPDKTGYMMAVLSIISGKIKGKYILQPDFNNKILEGNALIKGRIIIIEIINPCIKILLDKNAQKVYKNYKKLKQTDSHGGK